MNLYPIAEDRSRHLASIFLKGKDDRRPVNGSAQRLQEDPHWRDYLHSYEHSHGGDDSAGLGAGHQAGWTDVIARAMHLFATTTADQVLPLRQVAPLVEIQRQEKNQPEP